MTLVQIISLVATLLTAGWVAAFITQFIKQAGWSSRIKLILSFIVAGLVGLATVWLTGDVTNFLKQWPNMNANDVWEFAVLVYTAAATWYRFYFKDATWAQSLGMWPRK